MRALVNATIAFAAPQANFSVALTLTFDSRVSFDEVVLELPDFTGLAFSNFSALVVTPPSALASVSWSNERLTFTATTAVAADQTVAVTLPKAAGVRVPEDGVSSETRFMVFTRNTTRPDLEMPEVPVLSWPNVGVFFNTSVVYTVPRVGVATGITLYFESQMFIDDMSQTVLSLPNFTRSCGKHKTPHP